MSTRAPHPPDVIERVVQRLPEFRSYREAAAVLGFSSSTLQRWAATRGVAPLGNEPLDGPVTLPSAPDPATEPDDTDIDRRQGALTTDGGAPGPVVDRMEDPLFVRALHRYASLIANDVRPDHALIAARKVDATFAISDDEAARLAGAVHDLVKLSEPMTFAVDFPPRDVVKAFQMDAAGMDELTTAIEGIRLDGWVSAINAMLAPQPHDAISSITDPELLAHIGLDAKQAAAGVTDTWNRDVWTRATATWFDLRKKGAAGDALLATKAQRRDALIDDLRGWRDGRVAWKDSQVVQTEYAIAHTDALRRWQEENGTAEVGWIEPDGAQCDACNDALQLGDAASPVDAAVILDLNMPLHIGCVVPETEVRVAGDLISASRAFYDGAVITLRTAGGCQLTATANHPVLTRRGWLPAQKVRQGDHVLTVLDPIHQESCLAEVLFNELATHGDLESVNAAATSFHGDGKALQGAVEVVRVSGRAHAGHEERTCQWNDAAGHFANNLISSDVVIHAGGTLYTGSVYNVETASGLFGAGGIVTHNCDHYPVLEQRTVAPQTPLWAGQVDPVSVFAIVDSGDYSADDEVA